MSLNQYWTSVNSLQKGQIIFVFTVEVLGRWRCQSNHKFVESTLKFCSPRRLKSAYRTLWSDAAEARTHNIPAVSQTLHRRPTLSRLSWCWQPDSPMRKAAAPIPIYAATIVLWSDNKYFKLKNCGLRSSDFSLGRDSKPIQTYTFDWVANYSNNGIYRIVT